jgi:hypothetical protein
MSSGRKSSVKRHIENLHNGSASCIPFTEYLSGRRTGSYTFEPHSNQSSGLLDMLMKEAYKDFARKVANIVNGPVDNPVYSEIALQVKEHIKYRNFMDMLRDK